MGTVVMSHINQFGSFLHSLKCSLNHCFRTSGEGNNCTVGGFTRIYVQHFHPWGFNLGFATSLFDGFYY